MKAVFDSLESSGAYRADLLGEERARQPLWCNIKCDAFQSKRRPARKRFLANLTDEKMKAFKVVDKKVKSVEGYQTAILSDHLRIFRPVYGPS